MKRAQIEWKEHINKWKEHIKMIVERICFVHKSVTAFHTYWLKFSQEEKFANQNRKFYFIKVDN